MKLTKLERLLLSNQLKILEKVDPDNSDSYLEQRKALEEGFAGEYESLFAGLDDELDENGCEEVKNILQMYRILTYSSQKLPASSQIKSHPYLIFRGFDGNNEPKEYVYTQYLIIDLGGWTELKYGNKHPNFNSHTRMLDIYRNMYSEFKKSDDPSNLSESDIKRILEARG